MIDSKSDSDTSSGDTSLISSALEEVRDQRIIEESIHNHTNYSDGLSSIHELVTEIARLGMKSIALMDHWDAANISGGHKAVISENEDFDTNFRDIYHWRSEAIRDYIEDTDVDTREDESISVNIVEGAELDWHPHREDQLERELEIADFDAALLAVHYAPDGEDYRRMSMEDPEARKQEYLDELRRAKSFANSNPYILGIVHPDRPEMGDLDGVLKPSDYDFLLGDGERNGKIAARRRAYGKEPTAYFRALKNSDADYFAGFDTHRCGVSDKVNWNMNEAEKRLYVLEEQAREIGRAPERLLEPDLGTELNIPHNLIEDSLEYEGDQYKDDMVRKVA